LVLATSAIVSAPALDLPNASLNQLCILSVLFNAKIPPSVPAIQPRLHLPLVVNILYIANAHKASIHTLPNFAQAACFFLSFSSMIPSFTSISENIFHLSTFDHLLYSGDIPPVLL